jgi:hypothetical protein
MGEGANHGGHEVIVSNPADYVRMGAAKRLHFEPGVSAAAERQAKPPDRVPPQEPAANAAARVASGGCGRVRGPNRFALLPGGIACRSAAALTPG